MTDMGITKVEAMVPLQIPSEQFVMARFTVEDSGFVTIVFRDEDLAKIIITEAIENRLVHMGLYYAAAVPKEPE